MEKYDDLKLKLEWRLGGSELKVTGWPGGELLYSSASHFVHPDLSLRQVKWITEHYEKQRKTYVF